MTQVTQRLIWSRLLRVQNYKNRCQNKNVKEVLCLDSLLATPRQVGDIKIDLVFVTKAFPQAEGYRIVRKRRTNVIRRYLRPRWLSVLSRAHQSNLHTQERNVSGGGKTACKTTFIAIH